MSDLKNSVILPREDFLELQTAAWDPNSLTVNSRIATTVQTTLVFAAMAGAVAAGTWGWAKAMDWKEKRSFDRKMAWIKKENKTPRH